ncbi:MAG: hypothetical protein EAX95_06830 [Candidatus Thorarchaeota archaeon]|nr:hypothetical protein [Candidatus Thorarchaeota archaeon]
MNAHPIDKFKGTPAIAAFGILVVAAILTWWVNTVLAMLLVFVAMFVFSVSICSVSVEPISSPPNRERRRFGQWKLFPLEELEALEEELAEMLELETEEFDEGFSVPVEDMEEKSGSLSHELPLAIVEGIDDSYAKGLVDHGISDLLRLADADADDIALKCDIPRATASQWINEARGIVKGARITSILELAMSQPGELLVRINEALEEGRIESTGKGEFSERTVRRWIRAAKKVAMLSPDDIKRWRDMR